MKLYYAPGACSLSPHIVLCEAELPFELIKVDLQEKKTETGEDFRTVNPNGYVPVLVLDDGRQLTEGPAIIQYIADQAPGKRLAPEAGTFERYNLQQWLNFISTELHKTYSPLFNANMPAEAKTLFRRTLASRFQWVADQVASQPYLLGSDFTVADAYLFVMLRWGKLMAIDISRWPPLVQYQNKIADRPAVKRALQEEGLGAG
ncbi:glutathione transferase GstA [Methylobacter marinus]|uniref:glutathione transferase GstA n=1 Tax=Methylobacter marinus TaxID=34058 RepID=UPI00039D186C|nr:glutathione transferase GstA [Methylobacter marinus]